MRPQTTAPVLATRVMKARRETMCPACQAPITIGQLIAKCGYWMHAACLIEHNRKTSTEGKRS